ncbi:hypothetical protein OsJ_26701 [Oryza sativa Japonica Group]|uniref:Uncharacterized protein n=1 Tax=Oryza sativa subsp. japonica TaxID=39947 RepID=B9G009_ORYSJ|nr:hypothetical protein OsJ_26701 [Oryza sativa Japonica Group]
MPGAGSPLLPPPASSPPSPTAGNSPLLLLPLAFAEIPEARFNGCVTEWPASSRWRRWRLGVFGELPATSLNGGVDGDELGADLAASTPPHRCGQEAHSGVDSVGSDGVGGARFLPQIHREIGRRPPSPSTGAGSPTHDRRVEEEDDDELCRRQGAPPMEHRRGRRDVERRRPPQASPTAATQRGLHAPMVEASPTRAMAPAVETSME